MKLINIIILSVVGVFIILALILGIYTVNTGEVAVISRFGKVISVEGEGMKFKIPFIDKKTKLEVRDKLTKGTY